MKNTSLRNQIIFFIAGLTPFSLFAQHPVRYYYPNQSGYAYTYTNPPHVYTVEPGNYSYSSESVPNRYSFRVYTYGTSGQVADTIAFHVFRNFLYNNDYAYYNVVRKPRNYHSPFSVYTVDFYRTSKINY